jgi:hypothetical protein
MESAPPPGATPEEKNPAEITPRGGPCAGSPRCEEALALFDRLPAVAPQELLGRWRGEGFPTGHPLDGVLETYHWHGKRFRSAEAVDPLLFRAANGSVLPLRAVMPDPRWLERWPWLRARAAGDAFQRWLLPLLIRRRPQARLRAIEHRGVVTAAMVYDRLPILDVFRRLDATTLLGLMDARGIEPPFFFVLRRDDDTAEQPPPGDG